MIYTAEFSGLSIIIALIWFIASSVLNDKKKSKNNENEKSISNNFNLKNIRDFLNNYELTKAWKKYQEKPDLISSEHLDHSIEDSIINSIENEKIIELADSNTIHKKQSNQIGKDANYSKKNIFSKKYHKQYSYKTKGNLLRILKNKKELQKAILLKEIIDKPKALRR